MALAAGTVTITANATTGAPSYVGSGLALAMAQAYINAEIAAGTFPAVPAVGATTPSPWSAARPVSADDVTALVAARQRFYDAEARRAVAYASAIVTEITTNAKAFIDAAPFGVSTRVMPASTAAGTPIDPPASAVFIPIV